MKTSIIRLFAGLLLAAAFALIGGYFVYSLANAFNNPAAESPLAGGVSNSTCFAVLASPFMVVCCTGAGCVLTAGTVAMPVLFLRQRLRLMFSKQDDTSTTTAQRSGPMAPVAFVEPL